MIDWRELERFLSRNNYPAFRLKQIRHWFFDKAVEDFGQMKNIPRKLQEDLAKYFLVESVKISREVRSQDGQSVKALVDLSDGKQVESVLLRHKRNRSTICVSSQVGCAVGCRFCATGKMGFFRNLDVGEMVAQVLWARRTLLCLPPLFKGGLQEEFSQSEGQEESVENSGCLPTNVVFMGMGEPFLNFKSVVESLDVLSRDLGLGGRRVTVSTVGIVPKIKAFADLKLQVNLAVSLHAANEDLRRQLVPMSRLYDLSSLSQALDYYIVKTQRKVFCAYVMLDGVNDSLKEAKELVSWIDGRLVHVNLIQFNPIEDSEYRPSCVETIRAFQDYLQQAGLVVTVRYTMGQEIEAACGQLRLKNL